MVGAPDLKKVSRSYRLPGTFLFSRATPSDPTTASEVGDDGRFESFNAPQSIRNAGRLLLIRKEKD